MLSKSRFKIIKIYTWQVKLNFINPNKKNKLSILNVTWYFYVILKNCLIKFSKIFILI